MNMDDLAPRMLPCLIGKDEETGLFVGHCLTFDLVATGKTSQEADKNLASLIKYHIEYCYAHYQAGFEVTADKEDWDSFQKIVNTKKLPSRIEKIEVSLVKPGTNQNLTWLASVNIDGPSTAELCSVN